MLEPPKYPDIVKSHFVRKWKVDTSWDILNPKTWKFCYLREVQAIDNDKLLISDVWDYKLKLYDVNGKILGVTKRSPYSIYREDSEFIYEVKNKELNISDKNGNCVYTDKLSISNPGGMFLYDDLLYISDMERNRIYVCDRKGQYVRQWGVFGKRDGQFISPGNLIVDENKLYVIDVGNNRIQIFDLEGKHLSTWKGPHSFNSWSGISSNNKSIFYSDTNNSRIIVSPKIDITGDISIIDQKCPGSISATDSNMYCINYFSNEVNIYDVL